LFVEKAIQNLNKLGRGSLADSTYKNFKALSFVVSEKNIFLVFQLNKPRGGVIFGIGVII